MTQQSGDGGYWNNNGGEDPPAGSKRARLKGYLRAANELRQTYQQQYVSGWNPRGATLEDFQDGMSDAYPDAAVVTSGDEQMILFPSYARKHVKRKPEAQPGTIQEVSGEGRDYRDTIGAGDAEFMKQQWEEYEMDNAIVDVDVRGWVFSPHRGQMTRRQYIVLSAARRLAGLPAPTQSSPSQSANASRDASPHTSHRQRVEERAQRRDEEEAERQAEQLVKRGEKEADVAERGQYSEAPDRRSAAETSERSHDKQGSSARDNLRRLASSNAVTDDDGTSKITPVQRRATWNQPANMSQEELAAANAHLMARLAPFMSNPLSDTPISAFFYNENHSQQRTIHTNAYGHFALRAALNFVPTHVRILASEKLSATEEIIVTSPKGVSLISDIDDTIKHSAISSGAREIFRNAFIRDLADLVVDGVQDWYNQLAKLGVKFHYVSNSPWQLYPVLSKYFSMSGLPSGSFHLKQYSGVLQGIFEPVAERKKGTLDRIANDFPERRFILVGDSGEADLEVYLDFVTENPGRVLAILIRDVTTPQGGGFFDSSMGPLTGSRALPRTNHTNSSAIAQGLTFGNDNDDDPELKAAIAASLKTLEEEEMRSRPRLPPRRPTDPGAVELHRAQAESEDLIDLSDDMPKKKPTCPPIPRSMSSFTVPPSSRTIELPTGKPKAPPPTVPRKPTSLQSTASPPPEAPQMKKPPAPPPSRRPLNTAETTDSNVAQQSLRPSMQRQTSNSSVATTNSYREAAKQKLASAYNALPAAPWNTSYVHTELTRNPSTSTANTTSSFSSYNNGTQDNSQAANGSRRNLTAYPSAAATRVSNAWQTYNDPGRLSGPEQSVARNYSTNSSSAGGGNQFQNNQPVNKRLELWQQRWDRAREYCRERGVVLRSWRVGSDVMEETVRIVKRANEEDGNGEGKAGGESRTKSRQWN